MPRPKRDYGVAIRADIEKIDQQIRRLAAQRVRLERMLEQYDAVSEASDIDVAAVIRAATKKERRGDPRDATRAR